MKEKLRRSLAIAALPFVLVLMVATASAPAASAAVSVKSASQTTIQPATAPAPVPRGYPSILSLKCNSVTYGKIGINPITGQLYMCEYEPGIGFIWLPIMACPNSPPNYAGRHTPVC